MPDPFTQADFDALRARTPAGVVFYVWSPHMPLSVDGYVEAAGAARAVGLDLVPLLFAGSDADFARREAERGGVPIEGLRELAADSLIARDALVHAPTLIAYDDRGASPTLPGYRNQEGYADFLRDFLDR